MKVGLVCPYDMSRPGGVQSQIRGLAKSLLERGDDVVVIAPGLSGALPGTDLGWTVPVPGNGSVAPISLNPLVGGAIKTAASDIDVLHVHEPLMPTISLAALRAGPPVVATFHAAPGGLGERVYALLGSRLKRVLGDSVVVVTAVSATAAKPLPDDIEVQIIPNGVDTTVFALDVERHRRRICFLGRDEKRKGLDVLLSAWEAVSSQFPDAELVVMGANRGYSGITWTGWVDEATRNENLASSSIYVAPNLGGESFGIVLVEAMAAGAAVVASDLAPFRDVAGNDASYFPAGDSDGLARCLIELLGAPDQIARMSVAGRDRARSFEWTEVAASYRRAYERALS